MSLRGYTPTLNFRGPAQMRATARSKCRRFSDGAIGGAAGTRSQRKLLPAFAAGYDAIVDSFAAWRRYVRGSKEDQYLGDLLKRLPSAPDLLELGCGGGTGPTATLVARSRYVGVDISSAQVRRARERFPSATFRCADMTSIDVPAASFDAVVALFVLAHVPHAEIDALVPKVGWWLRPGGWFLGTLGARGRGETVEPDWLGVPMFFSSLAAGESRRLVQSAGLEIVQHEVVSQEEPHHGAVEFLWILARRPPTHEISGPLVEPHDE